MSGGQLDSKETVAEALLQLSLLKAVACCVEPDVHCGQFCGVDFDEPTCVACGATPLASTRPALSSGASSALVGLISWLRQRVDFSGGPPDDEVTMTSSSRQGTAQGQSMEGLDAVNTYIFDRFLYSRRDEEQLEASGRLKRAYCDSCAALYPTGTEGDGCHHPSCGGTVKGRSSLTNSLPLDQALAMFTQLLPHGGFSLRGKTLLDVGSRMGNNLLLSSLLGCGDGGGDSDSGDDTASGIGRPAVAIGVEISPFFAALSAEAATTLTQHDQAQAAATPQQEWPPTQIIVLCADIRSELKRLADADVVMLFNPFELHCTPEEHRTLLRLMAKTIRKPHARVVCCPSLANMFARAGVESTVIDGWVTELDSIGHGEDVHLYEVVSR